MSAGIFQLVMEILDFLYLVIKGLCGYGNECTAIGVDVYSDRR